MRKITSYEKGKYRVTVKYDSDLKEYSCRLFVRGKYYEPATYFTDDKEDAIASGETMVNDAYDRGFKIPGVDDDKYESVDSCIVNIQEIISEYNNNKWHLPDALERIEHFLNLAKQFHSEISNNEGK